MSECGGFRSSTMSVEAESCFDLVLNVFIVIDPWGWMIHGKFGVWRRKE